MSKVKVLQIWIIADSTDHQLMTTASVGLGRFETEITHSTECMWGRLERVLCLL